MSTAAPPEVQPAMKHIDEARLETDLPYRVGYLTEIMGMTSDDFAAIQESAEVLGPVVDALVDAVYEKLWKYDATQRHFRRPGSGFKQPVNGDIMSLDHPYIRFRKDRLRGYLVRLVRAFMTRSLCCTSTGPARFTRPRRARRRSKCRWCK